VSEGRRNRESGAAPEEERSEGMLTPSPELEAALREAEESVADPQEPRAAGGEDDPPGGGGDPGEGEALAESRDRLLRLQADFENFRKRAAREREEMARFGAQNLVKDLLSVVDNLDRALDHARQSDGGDLEGLLQGVELVHRELLGVFEKHHIAVIDADGQAFDPALHEAMAQTPDGSVEPNTVIDVLQKGYQLRDRLIRPARVVVARAPEETGTGDSSESGPGESTG
jgi:molecular chaperone GrpE